jgi:hypothetical protein
MKKRAYRRRYDTQALACMLSTAAQTASTDARLTLLLSAREALITLQSGEVSASDLSRIGNAVDFALILCERANNSAAQIEMLKRAQDEVMRASVGAPVTWQAVIDALDLLDALFAVCSPLEIGAAHGEWRRRVNRGLVLRVEPTTMEAA